MIVLYICYWQANSGGRCISVHVYQNILYLKQIGTALLMIDNVLQKFNEIMNRDSDNEDDSERSLHCHAEIMEYL